MTETETESNYFTKVDPNVEVPTTHEKVFLESNLSNKYCLIYSQKNKNFSSAVITLEINQVKYWLKPI